MDDIHYILAIEILGIFIIHYMLIYHPVYFFCGCIFLCGCILRHYFKNTIGIYTNYQDMSGKTVLITGASAGIGKATALDLARRNARVLLACRNVGKGNEVAEEIKSASGNQNVIVKCLDLTSFESVSKCANSVLETEDKLHVLINNAGILYVPEKRTQDGCEITMQTNHLGHFLLTLLLLDLMKVSSPSRIINVSSDRHKYSLFDVNDLYNYRGVPQLFVYFNSKLANILFTKELSEKLLYTGVTVNSINPGVVKTDIFIPFERKIPSILAKLRQFLFFVVAKTPEEGAQTTIRVAVDPALEKTTGKYFSDCKEAPVSEEAENRTLARQLFEQSEKTVRLTYWSGKNAVKFCLSCKQRLERQHV